MLWREQNVGSGKILAISLEPLNQISEVTESLIYQQSPYSRELSFPDWPSNWLQLGALSRACWIHNWPTNLFWSWAPTRAHWPSNLPQLGALIRACWFPYQLTNFLHLGDVFRAHWLSPSTTNFLHAGAVIRAHWLINHYVKILNQVKIQPTGLYSSKIT